MFLAQIGMRMQTLFLEVIGLEQAEQLLHAFMLPDNDSVDQQPCFLHVSAFHCMSYIDAYHVTSQSRKVA